MRGVIGILVLLGIAWLASEDRRAIRPRTVVGRGGAAIRARAAPAAACRRRRALLRLLDGGANALQRATDAGTGFVFGYLGGAPLPFAETSPGASFVLGFRALPLVLVISALAALLFHWGVLQRVTQGFAWLLRRTHGDRPARSRSAPPCMSSSA